MKAKEILAEITRREQENERLLVGWAIKTCEEASEKMFKEAKTSMRIATLPGNKFYDFDKAMEKKEFKQWLNENGFEVETPGDNYMYPDYFLKIKSE